MTDRKNEELMNGCKEQLTLDTFNLFEKNPHVHTIMMTVSDNGEGVIVCFNLNGEEYHAIIAPATESVVISIVIENERANEYLGISSPDQLIALLDSVPHISSILSS